MTGRTAAQQLRLIFDGKEHGAPPLMASLARELLAEHDKTIGALPPTQWTDPLTGEDYDLAAQYLDRDGDIWELSGWLYWTDGNRIPVFSAPGFPENDGMLDVPLPDVIASYGPLTVRPAAAKQAGAT